MEALGSVVSCDADPEVAPVLASGFETALVPAGVDTGFVPVAAAVWAELLPALPVADGLEPEDLDELEPDESEAVKNGLLLLPPVPVVKSRVKPLFESCCEILADTSSLLRALPLREA